MTNSAAQDPRSRRMNTKRSFLILPLAAVLLAVASWVEAASLPLSSIRVILPEEVLEDHTQRTALGDLLFIDATGARMRFITSVDDPAIANPGDGAFHPVDGADAQAILADVPSAFLLPLSVDLYLLPYPRAGALSSSSAPGAIYLSPGTTASAVRRSAPALLTHELGHAVQQALLPDSDPDGWARYERLRGIDDASRYNERAPHAQRPHEIFAEDFRVLFGGAEARGDGQVENAAIVPPENVPGLRAFFLSLLPDVSSGVTLASSEGASLQVFPNPIRAGATLTIRSASSSSLPTSSLAADGTLRASLYDATGRLVAEPHIDAGGSGCWILAVPSEDGAGRPLPRGAFWLRLTSGDASARPVSLPLRILR